MAPRSIFFRTLCIALFQATLEQVYCTFFFFFSRYSLGPSQLFSDLCHCTIPTLCIIVPCLHIRCFVVYQVSHLPASLYFLGKLKPTHFHCQEAGHVTDTSTTDNPSCVRSAQENIQFSSSSSWRRWTVFIAFVFLRTHRESLKFVSEETVMNNQRAENLWTSPRHRLLVTLTQHWSLSLPNTPLFLFHLVSFSSSCWPHLFQQAWRDHPN